MMLVLDTDHLVILQQNSSAIRDALAARLNSSGEVVSATIVSAEEQARGWLAAIHRERNTLAQVSPYLRFQRLFEFYSELTVLSWDENSVTSFEQHRANRIRIGTMDLKIACIAKSNNALLLTRNTVDFEKVPGLRFEDWLA